MLKVSKFYLEKKQYLHVSVFEYSLPNYGAVVLFFWNTFYKSMMDTIHQVFFA